jgi:hypothetical protein
MESNILHSRQKGISFYYPLRGSLGDTQSRFARYRGNKNSFTSPKTDQTVN